MSRFRKLLWTMAIVIAVSTVFGATYEQIGRHVDARRSPNLILQAKYLQARASELKEIQVSAAQARVSGGLGDKPLIVLSAVKQDDALKTALSSDDFTHFQEIWVRILQIRLVQLSSRGKQVILSDVGHDIPGERPGAIVDAVREIYDETSSPPIR